MKSFELDEESIFLIRNAIEGEIRTYRDLPKTDLRAAEGVPIMIAKYQKLLELFSSGGKKKEWKNPSSLGMALGNMLVADEPRSEDPFGKDECENKK